MKTAGPTHRLSDSPYDEGIVGSVEEYLGPEVLMEAPKEGQRDAECEEVGEAQWDDVDGSKDGRGEDDCHGWSETPGEAIEKRASAEDFFP